MHTHSLNAIFGKTLYDIKLEDVQKFFSEEQEETATLEFKSGDVSLEQVYVEIAAFLNTDGGLLIIGAPKETKRIDGAVERTFCKGDLTVSKLAKSKDSLAQKIGSHVIPASHEIRIHQIAYLEGSIFLIEVSQSLSPPHQVAEDGRYYVRMDRRSIPATHGFVSALFNKRRVGLPAVELGVGPVSEEIDNWELKVLNESGIPIENVCCLVDIFHVEGVEGVTDRLEFRFVKADDEINSRFSYLIKDDSVLVTDLNLIVKFDVTHKKRKYLIRTVVWSKDIDSMLSVFVYDPISKSLESHTKKEWDEDKQRVILKEHGIEL